jgi:hypothetical protein
MDVFYMHHVSTVNFIILILMLYMIAMPSVDKIISHQ